MGDFFFRVWIVIVFLKYVMLWESVRNSIEYFIRLGTRKEKKGDCSGVREVLIGAYNVLKLIAQLNCLTVVNYHF